MRQYVALDQVRYDKPCETFLVHVGKPRASYQGIYDDPD